MRKIGSFIALAFPLLAAETAPAGGGNTPTPKGKEAKEAKQTNRFAAIFGKVAFNPLAIGEPLTFKSGTKTGWKQYRLAEAIIELGSTGAYIDGAHIVCQVSPNGDRKDLLLQFPSSGGSFKKPMINAKESAEAAKDLADYSKAVVGEYEKWQRNRNEAGQTVAAPSSAAVSMGDDQLASLGIKLS